MKDKILEDELINLDAGAKHRYLQLIALEESGEELRDDDADMIHAEVLEAPIVEPQPAPLKPGEFYLSPKLCIEYGKPPRFVVDMDTFSALLVGIPVEEFRRRQSNKLRRAEIRKHRKAA